jgi:hypothetical protein
LREECNDKEWTESIFSSIIKKENENNITNDSFSISSSLSFEDRINSISKTVNNRLCLFILKKTTFLYDVRNMKDYLLLMRGLFTLFFY